MAFNSNNNGGDKDYRPTVYGGFSFTNPESNNSPARIAITYWKGLMKLHIQPKDENNSQNYVKYDDKNGNYAFLTPAKAKILADGISAVINGDVSSYGVTVSNDSRLISVAKSGSGYILIIGNASSSGIDGVATYEFSTGFYKAITNFNINDNSFGTEDMDSAFELKMLQDNLYEFYKASCSAMAYSVVDGMYFSSSKHTYETLNNIANKLGIQSGGKAAKNNSSFFSMNGGNNNNNAGRSSSAPAEIDDMSSLLGDFADEELPF